MNLFSFKNAREPLAKTSGNDVYLRVSINYTGEMGQGIGNWDAGLGLDNGSLFLFFYN